MAKSTSPLRKWIFPSSVANEISMRIRKEIVQARLPIVHYNSGVKHQQRSYLCSASNYSAGVPPLFPLIAPWMPVHEAKISKKIGLELVSNRNNLNESSFWGQNPHVRAFVTPPKAIDANNLHRLHGERDIAKRLGCNRWSPELTCGVRNVNVAIVASLPLSRQYWLVQTNTCPVVDEGATALGVDETTFKAVGDTSFDLRRQLCGTSRQLKASCIKHTKIRTKGWIVLIEAIADVESCFE